MPPQGDGSYGSGFREEVFNVFLAILLNERGIVSVPENIRKITKNTRRMPDIIITEFWGVRVIIEGRIFETPHDESSLIIDSRKRIEEGLSPICIAVLYPPEIRSVEWQNLKSTLENAKLRIKVITDSYEGDFFETNVDGLSAILRRTYELLVEEDAVNSSVEKLKEAIEITCGWFLESPSIPDRIRSILGIVRESDDNDPEDDLRVCRIAILTLSNALIFQEVLATHEARVQTVRRTLDTRNIIESFSQVWKFILDEINYVPIFKFAREILLELPSSPGTEKGMNVLSDVALEITQKRAAFKHDLMGRIFHRLLADAKYFGAFYTKTTSATLLLELAFDQKYWNVDFSKKDEIKDIKIADLACGTGTLLKAALEAIVDNHVAAIVENGEKPELADLHKLLVEDVIYGYDVLPFAAHLAASTLAFHEPDVPFSNMNLFVLPLSAHNSQFALPRLGSLDFLSDRPIPLQTDLLGSLTGAPSQVTGTGDVVGTIRIPELNFCVMNPPFTRSVGGNLLFGNFPNNERRIMQNRLQEIVKRTKIQANITAGLGSVFVALADKYIVNTGHIALVLPKTLLSGVAWGKTRKLLLKKYGVRYIIVSHEPNCWNFSENTELSECLLVADKKGNTNLSDNIHVVNLWYQPKSSVESLTLSSIIRSTIPVDIDGVGVSELTLNDRKYGESISIPSKMESERLWMNSTSFAQTELIRAAYNLSKGELYLPGSGIVSKIPLVSLDSVFTIGPDRRDVHDGFDTSPHQTAYPAIWGHDSDEVNSIHQFNNRFLSPLSRAKHGRPLRDPNLLWGRSGRLLLAERLWFFTHKLVAIWTPNTVLSNVWWTLRVKNSFESNIAHEDIEKIFAIWFNSTLGTIQMLNVRSDTRGSWINFKKPNLREMSILNILTLTTDQISDFLKLFDKIHSEVLSPWKEASNDINRQNIDNEIAKILDLPDFGILRKLLSIEPFVTLEMIH